MADPIDASAIAVPLIDVAALHGASRSLSRASTALADSGNDLHATWQGLSTCYEAPEAARLYTVMGPVRTQASWQAEDAAAVGKAVGVFADEVAPIVASLASTKASAQAFRYRISTLSRWDDDPQLVAENNGYLHKVNAAFEHYLDAERRCANTIYGLSGRPPLRSVGFGDTDPRGGEHAVIPDTIDMPWGRAVGPHRSCTHAIWSGVRSFFTDPASAGRSVAGFLSGAGTAARDAAVSIESMLDVTSWHRFAQTWTAMGQSMRPGPAQAEAAVAAGKSLLGWNQWRDHPAKAAGTAFFNVAAMIVPGGGSRTAERIAAEAAGRDAATVDITAANFAQKTFKNGFHTKGPLKGLTIQDVAQKLLTHEWTSANVPVDVIVRDGHTLILNTRSAQALTLAGIPRELWTIIDRTGQSGYENRLNDQLTRNSLDNNGYSDPTLKFR
jgi:hypothetical protein